MTVFFLKIIIRIGKNAIYEQVITKFFELTFKNTILMEEMSLNS